MDRLERLHEECWQMLEEGAGSAGHPFHTGVLATVADDGPRLRTVVLRAVDRSGAGLLCHTDLRSAKARQLADGGAVSWLFYDPERKLQLRLRGSGRVHHADAMAEERWSASTPGSRRCYLVSPGPGRRLDAPGSTLPAAVRERRPTVAETLPGRANFAVVATRVDLIDWLQLTSDGHRRARFRRQDGGWEGYWIAP